MRPRLANKRRTPRFTGAARRRSMTSEHMCAPRPVQPLVGRRTDVHYTSKRIGCRDGPKVDAVDLAGTHDNPKVWIIAFDACLLDRRILPHPRHKHGYCLVFA